jgi:hypothetical protein
MLTPRHGSVTRCGIVEMLAGGEQTPGRGKGGEDAR